jgi:hypothetical protein
MRVGYSAEEVGNSLRKFIEALENGRLNLIDAPVGIFELNSEKE